MYRLSLIDSNEFSSFGYDPVLSCAEWLGPKNYDWAAALDCCMY